jgi:putative alpha-amylase (1,4-alpha-D-glucanglucanohydrolase)
MFNMKKKRLHSLARAAMTLLLVMFATIGARADEGTLSGSGTATDPYLIGSDADWETFVSYINDKGGQYRYSYYKLTADIKVTSMAGKNNDDNAFKGVFDGNGHTMTLDLTDDGNSFCAPFRFVGKSTFKRLHIAGKITSISYNAASLVGYQRYGTLNIYNCWSSVDIMCTKKSSYSCNAGFVGYIYESDININNCRFDGSLQGADADGCSGFVGQRISNSSSMKISNCLFAPTQLTVATDNSYTFAYKSDVNTNNYYTTPLGKEQGTAIGNMTDSELLNKLGKGWEKKGDKIVPVFDIKNLSTGSIECNTFWAYTGEEVTVTPTVKDMDGNTVSSENYSVSFSPSPVKEVGQYTMTVASNTANGYSGTLTHQFEVAQNISGTGTKEDPYLITSTDDWNVFAKSVEGGIDYYNKFVKLTNNITISTMVGVCDESGNKPFRGTFDGDNHTLTANITSTATGDDKNNQGVAPFHLIKQATIQNLTVAGQITSASKYAAGLVGWVDGNYSRSYIKDCIVKATITTSADCAGGFVGNICYSDRNYLHFTNSVFAGHINNTSSDDNRRAGGFCGYGFGDSYFGNCLENGSYTNITYMNPRNAYGVFSNDRVNSLYYVNKIAVNNKYIAKEYGCYQVANTAPADELYLKREIKGYQFYQSVWITGLNDSYPYNNGEEVSLAYELKTNSGQLTKDTDYTVTLSSNAPAAVGTYTISFTAKEGNKAGYVGTTTRTFCVMEGEDLDGYVFDTEGEGESKVYLINNERDLERLAAYVNSGHDATGKTFKQNANITLTAAHTSIGGYFEGNSRYFKGTYDGNNKKISELTVTAPYSNYQGLFGNTQKAVIKNVTLANCNITGKQCTGGIVGYASASTAIENCHVNGNINATASDAGGHGGIAGSATATSITNCTVTGTISTSVSNDNYGGIVGAANYDVVITSCENATNISGDGQNHGGIVGRDNSGSNKFKYCLNTGVVNGNQFVGAIAGKEYSVHNYDHCYYPNGSTIKAFGTSSSSNDYRGYGEVAYAVTTGEHINKIDIAEGTVVTSAISGKKYCTKGDWTLTLTPDQTDVTFVSYACEGGTLSDLTTADGTHKLTITDKDVTISALVSNNDATDVNGVTIAAIPDMRWLGNVGVVPTITMTNGETSLVLGTDYIVEGSNNTAIGEATITIKGINNYKGTQTKKFNIVDFTLQDASAANSATNPYLITTAEDLEALASIVNTGSRLGGYYKQSADITLTNEHTAIGNSSNTPFKGIYDGDNKVIKGLLINQAEGTYQGLFGRAYSATITNVIIENCDITAKDYVGGICGHASETTISNCKVSGAIKTADGVDGMYHGGIAGYIYYKSISSCVNTASVKGNNSKSQYYGGIVGFSSYTRVTDCFNAGIVQGTSFVGSIVGKNNSTSTLRDNYHTTTTTGGVGANGVATGTDQTGATTVAKITATEGVTLTLPTTPTYVWNNENLYKSGVVVTLDCTVPEGKYWDQYTVNNGKISNAGVKGGEHTLTDFTADVVISATFASELTDIATAGAIIADIEDLTYNGKEQHPSPVVTLNSNVLEAGSNYQVTYSEGCTNVGTYTIKVEGVGRYSGTLTKTFNIVPYDISGCNITVNDKPYTGDVINVTPTVKYGSITLAQGEDKDYTFVTNPTTVKEGGDYTLTVTGKGNYTGTKEMPFNVYYPVPTNISCTNIAATTATVTWDKSAVAKKWIVEYSTDKTFESVERIDVNESTATLASLSADQVYYVRVKAVYGTNQESDWSLVCSVEPTTKLLVGSGNYTSDFLPFHNWYYYGLTQQIYTAKELGNKAGSIMALDFFKTDDKECNNTIEIYLVKTDKTAFTNSSDWISVTEADKVYDGKVQFESNQWTTIELTKPFDYDGVSNLALIVYNKRVDGDSYRSCDFKAFKGNDNQTLYFRKDDIDPTIKPTVTGTLTTGKNQLRIRMADKVTMNGLGIMSYASDNVLDFSNISDLTAHYASGFTSTANNAGVLTMKQTETTPAGEGLMLKGTANETFYVPALFNLTPEALTGNNLKGLTKITEVETTEGDKTNFILSQQNGVIAWYPLAAKYALKAHSAYLQLLTNDVFTNGGTRAISMEFEDGVTTGFIQIATGEAEDGDWYGIDGVKFNQKPTQRGVYINNGRKVIVK